MTADELGNDHGLQCPKCKQGDSLQIQVTRWANLLPNGTDDEAGDTEWDDESEAQCTGCVWEGRVKDLLVIELDAEPEPESEASKHADAGYMNDMRFGAGDEPDF